ncbi:2-oxoacid dehydrogenases acyltransferase-domain-containing protein [Phycomyces nitens]|nr:2-oxoacid dehydrogenases acyltransferase-domain-containing protein [Phycomyces nitens]
MNPRVGLWFRETTKRSVAKGPYVWSPSTTKRLFHLSRLSSANQPFLLADIGEGIREVEIIQWFVQPGSVVEEFDKICEVQSDKAAVEITSRYAGKISKLHHQLNGVATVGLPLVDIETDEEHVDAQATDTKTEPKTEAERPAEILQRQSRDPGVLKLATPAVRRLLHENNLEVTQIKGSGKNQRVLKEDVIRFLANKKDTTGHAHTFATNPIPQTTLAVDSAQGIPLTDTQKAMYLAMTRSLAIPQLGYKDEVDLTLTNNYRVALNKSISDHPGRYPFTKISHLPILLKSLSLALSQFPIMNASIGTTQGQGQGLVQVNYKTSHNIGLAMDTPQGLKVPNIKDVQAKNLFEIAADLHRLVNLAKANQLSASDLTGATITLSNSGTFGGTYSNPMVFPSELAIVALGKIQTLPRLENGKMVAKQVLPISWAADHRLIDGATIARFSNQWKHWVENPAIFTSMLK